MKIMSTLKCTTCNSLLEIDENMETVFCDVCGVTHNVAELKMENDRLNNQKNTNHISTKPSNNLSKKEISACKYVAKYIFAKIKADHTKELSLYNSFTHYSWKKSDQKKLISQMDIVLNNLESTRSYIIKLLEEKELNNIKLEIHSSYSTCSTEADWDDYKKKLEKYYSHSTEMQKLICMPENEKNGSCTDYTLNVSCRTNNKGLLLRKKELSYHTQRKLKKVLKIVAVIIVTLIVANGIYSKFFLNNNSDPTNANDILKDSKFEYYYEMSYEYSTINIHTEPSDESEVLTVIDSFDIKLIPTGEKYREWVEVIVDGEYGWVRSDRVTKFNKKYA